MVSTSGSYDSDRNQQQRQIESSQQMQMNSSVAGLPNAALQSQAQRLDYQSHPMYVPGKNLVQSGRKNDVCNVIPPTANHQRSLDGTYVDSLVSNPSETVHSSSGVFTPRSSTVAPVSVMPLSSWQDSPSPHALGDANYHFVNPFAPKSSIAAAAVNLGSLVHEPTSNHGLKRNGFGPLSNFISSTNTDTKSNHYNCSAFSPTSTNGQQVFSSISNPAASLSANPDKVSQLQKELEQERALRMQLQQHTADLNQKVRSQMLVEQGYEDLSVKCKHAFAQIQQMSVFIERYKSIIKQLEQEKRLLVAENQSLKAQENVAHDKTMLYNILMERSKKLEEENSSLVLENEMYQRQYEKSIDEISKQVVAALVTQKGLQEQCLQVQHKLLELERENMEYGEAIRQARQASSDSKLIWSYRSRARTQTASPSADSVRSMPAQHLYWRQNSIGSLDHPNQCQSSNGSNEVTVERNDKKASVSENNQDGNFNNQTVCVETEFPASNGSPKSTRKSLDRHPSSGSLDSAYHCRGFVKYNGKDVRCQRSVSAEALRDMKVNVKHNDLTLSGSLTTPALSRSDPVKEQISEDSREDLSGVKLRSSLPESEKSAMVDSGVGNDPFAESADDILSKHQSLIVGSMEDIFSTLNGGLKNDVIQEEELSADTSSQLLRDVHSAPTPPPRPHSRCLSDCSLTTHGKSPHVEQSNQNGRYTEADQEPPPLPPKQYKGSRRPYKPLPAEPDEQDYHDEEVDSSDKNTDSESIKQEINALTSKIARMAASAHHH